MRKYDRNAVFNIILKALLFLAVFAVFFCIFKLIAGMPGVVAFVIAVIPSIAVVLLFSYLLRYTVFYYGYYAFVSKFIHRSNEGSVYCPCCGKHFDQFKDERFYSDTARFNPDMFARSRQDVICDFCRSAPRHRIIAEWAEQNRDMLKDARILYFAPELSMMLWFRRNGIRVRTADLYDKRADLKLDLTALDLPDESEDIVFCNHVLEHVADYSSALSELHRIIRIGGTLIISFPIDKASDHVREEETSSDEERIRLYGQSDHLRVFGKDSRQMLEEAGFNVSLIDIGNLPETIVPVEGPADYDSNMVFVCVKKE